MSLVILLPSLICVIGPRFIVRLPVSLPIPSLSFILSDAIHMLFRMFYVARLSVKIPDNDNLFNEFLGPPSGHTDQGIPVKNPDMETPW